MNCSQPQGPIKRKPIEIVSTDDGCGPTPAEVAAIDLNRRTAKTSCRLTEPNRIIRRCLALFASTWITPNILQHDWRNLFHHYLQRAARSKPALSQRSGSALV